MSTPQLAAPSPTDRVDPWLERTKAVLPGLLLCVLLAGVSYAIAAWPALNAAVPLSALTVGILLGVIIRLGVPIPAVIEPGIRWTLHYLLRAGIILLGFRLVFQDVLSVGFGGLALVLVVVASTITLAVVIGRALKLPDTLSVLIGCGTGICGASAVVAVDGVIRGISNPILADRVCVPKGVATRRRVKRPAHCRIEPGNAVAAPLGPNFSRLARKAGAKHSGATVPIGSEVPGGREQDVACAIATVTVFGTVAMFAYPAIAPHLGLSEAAYAAWAGSSIHEVAQAVAAGFAFDQHAGVDASLYKLSRVAMLAPVCAVLALWWRRRAGGEQTHQAGKRGAPFPLFVAAFVLVVGVNSLVDLPGNVHDDLVALDSGLLAAAMVAMGLQTRLVSVARLGWRPLFLGACVAFWISALGLAGALLITG